MRNYIKNLPIKAKLTEIEGLYACPDGTGSSICRCDQRGCRNAVRFAAQIQLALLFQKCYP